MDLPSKIIELRRRNAWSQEDLASKVGLTRQSISKWESGISTPEIDKLVMLSELFDVSLDTLLKDDIEIEIATDNVEGDEIPNIITEEDALSYLRKKRLFGIIDGIATILMILSPITLIISCVFQEEGKFNVSESVAVVLGLVILLVLVAIGVGLYIYAYFQVKDDNERMSTGFKVPRNVKSMIEKKKKEYENTYLVKTIIGTIICIVSVIPLFVMALFDDDSLYALAISLLLAIASIGVYLFIESNSYRNGMLVLLKENTKISGSNKLYDSINSCLWVLAVGIYLLVSFLTSRWELTWLIFLGTTFISVVLGIIFNIKNDKD